MTFFALKKNEKGKFAWHDKNGEELKGPFTVPLSKEMIDARLQAIYDEEDRKKKAQKEEEKFHEFEDQNSEFDSPREPDMRAVDDE